MPYAIGKFDWDHNADDGDGDYIRKEYSPLYEGKQEISIGNETLTVVIQRDSIRVEIQPIDTLIVLPFWSTLSVDAKITLLSLYRIGMFEYNFRPRSDDVRSSFTLIDNYTDDCLSFYALFWYKNEDTLK